MKYYIRDLSEIKESEELLEAKPHFFVSMFISILVLFIIILLTWSYFGKKDVVIKAYGEIRPEENVSTIRASFLGKIEEIHYSQGQKIMKDDELFTLNSDDLEVEMNSFEKKVKELDVELNNLKLLKESIEKNKNLFSKDIPSQIPYYEEFQGYQAELSTYDSNFKNSITQLENQQLNLTDSINGLDNQADINKVNEDTRKLEEEFLIDKANSIQATIESLTALQGTMENREQKTSENIENEEDMESFTSVSEFAYSEEIAAIDEQIATEKEKLEETNLQLEKVRASSTIEIESKGVENRKKILEKEYKKLGEEINNNIRLKEATISKVRLNKILEINQLIKGKKEELSSFKDNINSLNIQAGERIIKAPIDGTINIQNSVNVGDLVSPETVLLTIIPNEGTNKTVLYISNNDISNLSVGDEVKYHLSAFRHEEYGELRGKIINISSDTFLNESDGLNYYKVEATIEGHLISEYTGNKAEFNIGMQVEAYIITDTQRILHYVLEKLNFKQ